MLVAAVDGVIALPFERRLDPPPTVGDWIAYDGTGPVAVLPRASLLRRRSAEGVTDQALAANVDVVLLVCGLDRPVRAGRIRRSAALTRDAGATPVVVLTKAALATSPETVVETVVAANPGLDVILVSAVEGIGLDGLRDLARRSHRHHAGRIRCGEVEPGQCVVGGRRRRHRRGARPRRQGSSHHDDRVSSMCCRRVGC